MASPSRIFSAPSVGRALAEIGIIVAGVLIALGADAWWTNREQAELREEYRAAMIDDLAADSSWYAYLIDSGWLPDGADAIDSLNVALLDDVDRPEETVALWASRTMRLIAGTQRSGAFDELVATGRLGLFEDPGLRQEMVRYYGVDIVVDRAIYATWVENDFFPWRDRLREVTGVRWYQALVGCLNGFDVDDPDRHTDLDACIRGLSRIGVLTRLRSDPEAIGHVQDLYLLRAFLNQGQAMQATRVCLSDWLLTGVRPELCEGSERIR